MARESQNLSRHVVDAPNSSREIQICSKQLLIDKASATDGIIVRLWVKTRSKTLFKAVLENQVMFPLRA